MKDIQDFGNGIESEFTMKQYRERREEIYLSNPIFSEVCRNELKEIDKHEIVVKICEQLGGCPTNLCIAESIFENIKFDMTRYVLHHEYSRGNGIQPHLLLWLDSITSPDKARRFKKFIHKYLK